MPDKKLCPTCHSEIGEWTDDPILTAKGLSGDEYKGAIPIKVEHIKELQDKKTEQETDMGFLEDEITQFTKIIPKEQKVIKEHINELRKSTEKILTDGKEVTEEERTELLKQYFNYDVDGNYIGTYKYGLKVVDKKEWTDVDKNNIPNLPDNKIKIKAIHIEDLRHFIPIPNWFVLITPHSDGMRWTVFNKTLKNGLPKFKFINEKEYSVFRVADGSLALGHNYFITQIQSWPDGGQFWRMSLPTLAVTQYRIFYDGSIHGATISGDYFYYIQNSRLVKARHDFGVVSSVLVPWDWRGPRSGNLSADKDFIYVSGYPQKIYKYTTDLDYLGVTQILPFHGYGWIGSVPKLCCDKEFIYATASERFSYEYGGQEIFKSYLIKLTKNLERVNIRDYWRYISYIHSHDLTVDDENLYIIDAQPIYFVGYPFNVSIYVLKKSDLSLVQTLTEIDGQSFPILSNPVGHYVAGIATYESYKYTK